MESLQEGIVKILERNQRVEADKAWETSWFRRLTITILTYIIALWWMWSIKVPDWYLAAFIPTGGYFLSTLTLPVIKRWWLKRYEKIS